MVGDRFGRLTVRDQAEPRLHGTKHRKSWTCFCDCGNQATVLDQSLKSGATTSCGCFAASVARKKHMKHGHSAGRAQTKTYKAWRDMLTRCLNPRARSYKNYGGRGVKVCDRWLVFSNFLEDMGECPDGLTLDRSEADDGYYKENCAWAGWDDQALHKRAHGTQLLTYEGLTLSPSKWACKFGIPLSTIYSRLRKGWPLHLVFSACTLTGKNRNGKLHN